MILEELKQRKIERLKSEAKTIIDKLKNKYEDFEVESFVDQRTEWRAWKNDNTAQTPIVDTLANIYGITKDEMMQRIEAKVLYIIQIQGNLRVAIDKVEECETEECLEGIKL